MDESAFPHVNFMGQKITGMTLRDYFAAQSLKGFIQEEFHRPTYKQVAEACYKFADAMLEARKNESAPTPQTNP